MRPDNTKPITCARDADCWLYHLEDDEGEMAWEGSSDGDDY